jgi:hypothetical protein
MSTLKSNFISKYKINDRRQIERDIVQWQTDILNGDDTAVRLTDFVVYMYKPIGKVRRGGVDAHVTKVQGYQIVLIERAYIRPMSIYSPLVKQMLGHYDPLSSYDASVIPTYLAQTHYAIHDIGLDPLDDDTTKRLMLAGKVTNNYFTNLCIEKRGNANANNCTRWLCKEKKTEDPLLAMVGLINTLPIEERKRILDVYDSYGTIDTLVGDALNHLDKFRTL